MSDWIRCDAYFSERPRTGPFWIRIDDRRIAEIRDAPPERGLAPENDADAVYVMPLLSDTHAHVYMNPWPLDPSARARPGSGAFEDELEDATARLRSSLRKGIGFVRDMGDPFGINLAVRDRVAKEPRDFPAYQAPGPAIHRPKKYGRFLGVTRESLRDVQQLIDELAETRAIDFIKLVTTGIVNFSKREMNQAPQYSLSELKAIADQARSLGLPIASHCSGQDGIERNLEAGIHFIEHAYFATPQQLERMRDQGQYWTPTFAPVYQQAVNSECPWDSPTRRALYQLLVDHNHALTWADQFGSPVLAGTDAGSPGVDIGAGLLLELNCLARSLSWEETLRIATAANADACRHPDYTGRIEAGSPASFALYSDPPWQVPSALGDPRAVYHLGRLTGQSADLAPSA